MMKRLLILFLILSSLSIYGKKDVPTVMLQLRGRGVELSETMILVIRMGVSDILTRKGYELVDEGVQKKVIKEQADQHSKGCYDNECLVETGQMLSAQAIFSIEIVKLGKSYIFNLKYIDSEKGTVERSTSLTYKSGLSEGEKLLNFSKKITEEAFKEVKQEVIKVDKGENLSKNVDEKTGEYYYKKGKELFNAKNYKEAAEYYKKGCDLGNGRSCGNLGLLYQYGFGVTKNYYKAVEYYKKGCGLGDGYFCKHLKNLKKEVDEELYKLKVITNEISSKIVLEDSDGKTINLLSDEYMKLKGGKYKITISKYGYETQNKTVILNEDREITLNIYKENNNKVTKNEDEKTSKKIKYDSNYFVNVDNKFLIGKYEVTQKEYKDIMGENPSKFKGDNLPVERVSWYDAVKFCNKKSIKDGLEPVYTINGKKVTIDRSKNGYRLPDSKEWEYAAKGGSLSKNYKYSGSDNVDEVAWYDENSSYKTHSVGTKKPNELDIYDMSGNVCEWCNDWDSDYPEKVLRGGSWNDHDLSVTISYWYSSDPPDIDDSFGFRVLQSLK